MFEIILFGLDVYFRLQDAYVNMGDYLGLKGQSWLVSMFKQSLALYIRILSVFWPRAQESFR